MLWLTAHDIHPPLYYGLLHGWIKLADTAAPAVVRLFSVGAGLAAIPLFAGFTYTLYPNKRRLIFLATLLLLISPIHIYYSQEVRMYGLALGLGLVSSTFAWHLLAGKAVHRARNILGYAISAALCLYTLYFSLLLLAAHFLYALWAKRHQRSQLRDLLYAEILAFVLYLPWLLYVTPKLIAYVTDKVAVEKDIPLGPVAYFWRHLWAFINGHILPILSSETNHWQILAYFGPLAALLLLLSLRVPQYYTSQPLGKDIPTNQSQPLHLLFALLIVPCLGGFFINYLWPFFPLGGERMLLFVLPYFLLLLAVAVERWLISRYAYIGWCGLSAVLLSASLGIITFYTAPRHSENDYRSLINQVIQQGREGDTFLTLFPWQVGYWRAYQPHGAKDSPQPLLIADGVIKWGGTLQNAIDKALQQGTLWFPEPRAFGSTLPAKVRTYVQPQTANLIERWYTPTTLLSGWHKMSDGGLQNINIDFGQLSLANYAVTPVEIASSNEPLHISLQWQISEMADREQLYVTLRLQDDDGYTWASRDYTQLGQKNLDRVGLFIPVGLPPGVYQLRLGVGQLPSEKFLTTDEGNPLVQLSQVVIQSPTQQESERLNRFQLPIQQRLTPPVGHNGLVLLGSSGISPENERLAGTEIELVLFFRNRSAPISEHHLYVSILDKYGNGVGGWEGWPLPHYPMAEWPKEALVQVPVQFPIPATLSEGDYELVVGLVGIESGEKTPYTVLDRLYVKQRSANFSPILPEQKLELPVQFGTHLLLNGYEIEQQGNRLKIVLYWKALQTLLPEHHIFVHLNSELINSDQGNSTLPQSPLAQDDGPPTYDDEPLPSGSWLAGEYLRTSHMLLLPPELNLAEIDLVQDDIHINVGLYNPKNGVRLPASQEDQIIGDAAILRP